MTPDVRLAIWAAALAGAGIALVIAAAIHAGLQHRKEGK